MIDRPDNRFVDFKSQLGGKTNRAQHPHRILAHTLLGITDQYDTLPPDVLEPTRVIPNAEISNVVVQCVAGEIAPPDILVNGTVDVVSQDTPLVIAVMIVVLTDGGSPECRNFDDLAPEAHMRQAKTTANQSTITKQRLDFLWRCVRGDVEVLRMQLEHCIAHSAANQEGLIARLVQSVQNLECAFGKLGPSDVVIRPGDYSWFFRPVLRVLLQQLIRLRVIVGAV